MSHFALGQQVVLVRGLGRKERKEKKEGEGERKREKGKTKDEGEEHGNRKGREETEKLPQSRSVFLSQDEFSAKHPSCGRWARAEEAEEAQEAETAEEEDLHHCFRVSQLRSSSGCVARFSSLGITQNSPK
ncbi:uncharacterized protein ASCRUDRAFT_77964 [Ascoidea rubescens DSM 1968]|uniref:Uncharacterized protein n=1 Tax=Ascoidea rubescens DSM 1968 TaxID=1344418 RepID=A0A1D2V9D9_9ASCO|nr:hypothetical protein ASCRUDRAFT_77964 [Ascoidea rubescens DSM 1968]ODV58258.1 hypothetical protein ASCRUDRAFT_77964 [Ascoidea rubescens DSM 1968]